MTANVAPPGLTQIFTDNGAPAALYKIWTYDSGTATPRTTWADAGEVTPNANPVVLDANGRAQIYYRGNYRIVLTTPADAVVWTQDNFNVVDPSASVSTVFANGSAATPSVRFAQATSSGLFSPAANVVAMSINGAEATRWSAGNFGVGGTPTQKLDVFGTARIQGALTITTGGITVTAGGMTITAGGLTVTAGNVSIAGGTFASRGFADNATAAAWSIDSGGRLINNGTTQPAFAAYRSSTTQTAGLTLVFNTEQFDHGSNYNNATGVFTAPIAGIYVFSASAQFTNNTGGNVGFQFSISCSTAGIISADSTLMPTGTNYAASVSAVVKLAAGETVSVVLNTALTATFLLQASDSSRFMGYQLAGT